MKKILFSGIQPTNNLTIGNYFGVIKSFQKLQNEYELILFIADLHALSSLNKIDSINLASINLVKYLMASGLDLNKVTIFRQSDIPQHLELFNVLLNNTTIGELSRMTQYKDRAAKCKQANGTEFIPTGLLMYPVLMSADILLYNPDYVIVGQDQKQHLELARNLAIRLNHKYHSDFFKIPEPFINEVGSKIMDLQDPSKKMSKSSQNTKGTIFLNDNSNEIETKIKQAKTDSLNSINFDPINQPAISNLISIYACLKQLNIKQALNELSSCQNYGDLKNKIAPLLTNELKQLNDNFNQISDQQVIDLLNQNKQKIIKLTSEKIKEIYKLIGLI